MTRASVVIVSNGRPDHLRSCLQSLRHQTHRNFEVVVVADTLPAGFAKTVRYQPFTVENIAAARNIGIMHTGGEILAFCDDDAIPDPSWLENLVAPFADAQVGSSGGFTRGRNGISLQWGAMRFDTSGEDQPLEIPDDTPQVFPPDPDLPVKLVGTNMAFRKTALESVGGFDEAFRFYLEDADIKLRLDQQGWKSALVPKAQVQHGFAASNRRTEHRVPTTLFEIGASKAYFCTRHFKGDTQAALQRFRTGQKRRLQEMLHRRLLEPAEIERLLRGLVEGISDGQTRSATYPKPAPPPPFRPFPVTTGPHVLLCIRPRNRQWADETARALLENGCTVSVLKLAPSLRYFQVQFRDGYWQHSGGVWGRAERDQPLIQLTSYRRRFAAEVARIGKLAGIDLIATPKTGGFVPETPCLAPLRGHNVEQLTSVNSDEGVSIS